MLNVEALDEDIMEADGLVLKTDDADEVVPLEYGLPAETAPRIRKRADKGPVHLMFVSLFDVSVRQRKGWYWVREASTGA